MHDRYGSESVDTALRRRGFSPTYAGDHGQLLLPVGLAEADWVIPVYQVGQFAELFGKNSFRKVARRLTAARGEPVSIPSLQAIAGRNVAEYLAFLVDLNVVNVEDDWVRLVTGVDNIGPTLEWYIADACERQLPGSAEWSVHLEGLPAGGDYDVLAWFSPILVYIEAKSSRPHDISDGQLRRFLQRSSELAPDIALLLLDTDDGLEEFVNRLVGLSRFTVPNWPKLTPLPGSPIGLAPQPDFPGVFFGSPRTYVTNSEPSIITQLQRCLQHYHRRVRPHYT
jgi:hypothetical protein